MCPASSSSACSACLPPLITLKNLVFFQVRRNSDFGERSVITHSNSMSANSKAFLCSGDERSGHGFEAVLSCLKMALLRCVALSMAFRSPVLFVLAAAFTLDYSCVIKKHQGYREMKTVKSASMSGYGIVFSRFSHLFY